MITQILFLVFYNSGVSFYYHILTHEYSFQTPENFTIDGSGIIPEEKLHQKMTVMDNFTFGQKINAAEKKRR